MPQPPSASPIPSVPAQSARWKDLENAAWSDETLIRYFALYPNNVELDAWLLAHAPSDRVNHLLRLARVAHGLRESPAGTQQALVGLPMVCDSGTLPAAPDFGDIAYAWSQSMGAAHDCIVTAMPYPVSAYVVHNAGATQWADWLELLTDPQAVPLTHRLPMPTSPGPWVWIASVTAILGQEVALEALLAGAAKAPSNAWRIRVEQRTAQLVQGSLRIGAPLFLADALNTACMAHASKVVRDLRVLRGPLVVQRAAAGENLEVKVVADQSLAATLPGQVLPDAAISVLEKVGK